MTAATTEQLSTRPVCIGSSHDGRTNRWRITCPVCETRFEPQTTMFNEQGLECPKPRCQSQLLADYRKEEVTVVKAMKKPVQPAAKAPIDPSRVIPGMPVCRRPSGRVCTVEEVCPDRSKVLVQDCGKRFWVSMVGLVKNWY